MGAYVRIIIDIGARDEKIHVTSLHPFEWHSSRDSLSLFLSCLFLYFSPCLPLSVSVSRNSFANPMTCLPSFAVCACSHWWTGSEKGREQKSFTWSDRHSRLITYSLPFSFISLSNSTLSIFPHPFSFLFPSSFSHFPSRFLPFSIAFSIPISLSVSFVPFCLPRRTGPSDQGLNLFTVSWSVFY